MASSLIRINEATAEELQALPSIGPKRADRIIRYREQVSPLTHYSHLATAAGIGHNRARDMARHIDWSAAKRPWTASILFAACAGIACIFLYHYALQGEYVAGPGPGSSLYFICILLILSGSFVAIVTQLLANLSLRIPGAGWFAVIGFASGIMLLAALVLTTFLSGSDDRFTTHVIETGELTLFISIIIVLLYGPGWHVRSSLRGFGAAAIIFDLSQVALGTITLAVLTIQHRPALIAVLFGLWAGVTLGINSRELIQGRSSYVGSLTERERARLQFIVSEESATPPGAVAARLLRPAGWLLAALSLALIGWCIRMLLERY